MSVVKSTSSVVGGLSLNTCSLSNQTSTSLLVYAPAFRLQYKHSFYSPQNNPGVKLTFFSEDCVNADSSYLGLLHRRMLGEQLRSNVQRDTRKVENDC